MAPALSQIEIMEVPISVTSHFQKNDTLSGPILVNGTLVAREEQLSQLQLNYERRTQQRSGDERPPELVLITGKSGTGKRTLARSLEQTVIRDGGYFLMGQCDHNLPLRPQHHQSDEATSSGDAPNPAAPYAPFVEAFSRFVKQVLDRGDEAIQRVRDALTEEEGELLIDIIPDFQKLLEPISGNYFLGSNQEKRTRRRRRSQLHRTRLHGGLVVNPNIVAMKKFLISFCSRSRLVLVLDSVQWIDQASLSLLGELVSERDLKEGLTLIATCRGDEVAVGDPLAVMLRELEESVGVQISNIQMLDLAEPEVNLLIAEALEVSEEETKQLSYLLHQQTDGNPLSVKRLLQSLHERCLLRTMDLNIDMEGIKVALQKLDPTDVDMLSSRIEQLSHVSETVHQVLQVASCLGSEFSASHVDLVVTLGTNLGDALSALGMLEKKRVIWTSNEGKKGRVYRWAHEKVQESAYKLILEKDRASFQKSIGLTLLRNLHEIELEESVFIVANQLVNVDPSLLERDEKVEVSTLCGMAGKKLAQSAAFDSACYYFNHAIKLLEEHSWSKCYGLKLSMYNAAAEMECCNGNHHKVDLLVGHVIDHASRCFEDTLRAYETHIYSLCARQDLVEAIKVGLYVLKRLGEPFQLKDVSSRRITREIQECRRLLNSKKDRDILNLKPLRDWKKVYAIRIIQLLFPPIFQSQPHLGPLFAARVVKLTFEHGLTSMSCAGFAILGTILCYPVYGAYIDGNRSARLGLEIMEKFDAVEMKCRILCYMNAFCTPYVQPVRRCLTPLTEAAEAGLSTGDIEMSCFNSCLFCIGSLFAGFELGYVLGIADKYRRNFRALKHEKHAESLAIVMQTILNILGKAQDPFLLKGDACDEEQLVKHYKAKGHLKGIQAMRLLKCFLAMYLNGYGRAHELSLEIQKCKKTGLNAMLMIQMIFLEAMSSVTIQKKSNWMARPVGNSSLKQLRQYAEYCPENVLNKVYLVEAEQLSLRKQREKAVRRFDMSIQLASQNSITQEQALANERAGLRLLEWGMHDRALEYLEEAKRLYGCWGSTYKVGQITALVLRQVSSGTESSDDGTPTVSSHGKSSEMRSSLSM